MVQTVTFPGLGWSFELNRVAFSIGGLNFYWYGLLIGIGFMVAILYGLKRGRQFGVSEDRMIDVIFGATIVGILGARLYYVAFRWDYYSQNLSEIFNTRNGGLAIYGGVIGGFLAGYLLCKWRKVRFLPMADAVAGGFLIAQSIGRWGNFVNVEAFGSNTSAPWGMGGPAIVSYLTEHEAELEAMGMQIDPNMPVHPTFFYESMWCLLGFIVMQFLVKKRKFDGELLLFYLGWYGAGRMVIEGLRTDSLMIGSTGIRVSQLLAALLVAAAIGIWLLMRKKLRQNPQAYVLYVNTEESKALLREAEEKERKKSSKKEETPAPQESTDASKEKTDEE